jgi:hypothetical protein
VRERIKLDPKASSYGEDNWGFCLLCGKQQEVTNACEGCGKDCVMSVTMIKFIGKIILKETEEIYNN